MAPFAIRSVSKMFTALVKCIIINESCDATYAFKETMEINFYLFLPCLKYFSYLPKVFYEVIYDIIVS